MAADKANSPAGTIARASGKDGPQIVASSGKRWTDEAEAKFLDHLGASCNVTRAAAAAGFTARGIYARRARDPSFAARWQVALEQGYARIEIGLVEAAANRVSGHAPDPDAPFPEMSVRDALAILQLHRASVKGDGATRRAGWQARPRPLDEVRDSILKKLEAFDRIRSAPGVPREGDRPKTGGGVLGDAGGPADGEA